MNFVQDWKPRLDQFWASVSDGWAKLRERAGGALTHYSPDWRDGVPKQADGSRLPVASWAYLAVDVYDTSDKIVVRVEAPGMTKEDISYSVRSSVLTITGAKRFEHTSMEKNYRILECAYGSFQRMVTLPVAVDADRAEATYQDGVLRLELPKADGGKARRIDVRNGN